MSNQTEDKPKTGQAEKPGFFQRIVGKLDASLKQKAEANARQSDCCSGNDKGGKCC